MGSGLGITAGVHDLERQIEQRQTKLLGYDRLVGAADVAMPEPVREYVFDHLRKRVGTAEQFSVWRSAADKLRADPQAAIEIAEPPAPPHVPSASHQTPHVAAVLTAQAKARAEQAQPETPPEAAA
jgi:hypothetical protein